MIKDNCSIRYSEFMAYCHGWSDGAGSMPMNFRLGGELVLIYEKGYKDGRLARGAMSRRMAKKYGINLSPLRTNEV